MEKKFEIGDLVQYKNKLYLVTEVQSSNEVDNKVYSYMYRLNGVQRWILDMFIKEAK